MRSEMPRNDLELVEEGKKSLPLPKIEYWQMIQPSPLTILNHSKKKGKAIPVTGHGGPWGCETSRLPHFLENRLTDGGAVSCSNLFHSLRMQIK
jgi:hypothetical protein